jgi:hypothetical protein
MQFMIYERRLMICQLVSRLSFAKGRNCFGKRKDEVRLIDKTRNLQALSNKPKKHRQKRECRHKTGVSNQRGENTASVGSNWHVGNTARL